jgi:hypothetical protein
LVLDFEKDGPLGLNFHYLPVIYRAMFLDKLLEFAEIDDKNNIKKIRVSYDILMSSKKYPFLYPCLKKYLYSQMRSPPLKIFSHEYETAMFLPVEQFKKQKKETVFKESVGQQKGGIII